MCKFTTYFDVHYCQDNFIISKIVINIHILNAIVFIKKRRHEIAIFSSISTYFSLQDVMLTLTLTNF